MVACTIGYALFSETITIMGTATAKGDWELTTTCKVMKRGDLVTYLGGELTSGATTDLATSLSKNNTITCTGNAVTISSELTAPGGVAYFMAEVENTGSIPAILKSTSATGNNDNSLVDTPSDSATFFLYNVKSTDEKIIIDNTYVKNGVNSSDWQEESYRTLQPGDKMQIIFISYWDDADTAKAGINETISGTWLYNFEQVKAQ